MGPPYEPLTFRDITEVYRREKRSRDITDIRSDFYSAVEKFIQRSIKENEEEMTEDPFSLKALSISDTIKKASAKTVQIFEIRAEKILLMALRASSGSNVDTGKLTKREKNLFNEVFSALSATRSNLISQDNFAPKLKVEPSPPPESVDGEEEMEVESERPLLPQDELEGDDEEEPHGGSEEEIEESPEEWQKESAEDPEERTEETPDLSAMEPISNGSLIVVRMLEDVPPFAGPERDYRLMEQDVVALPTVIGKALVSKGMAEEVKTMSLPGAGQ